MTRDTLFLAFGNVKSDYLHAAAASMEAPVSTLPRPRLRFALIAASFLLIAAMIPILVILAKHTTPPPLPPTPATSDSETSSTPSTEAPTTHLSITDIPGAESAEAIDLPLEDDALNSMKPKIYPMRAVAHEWINSIKENHSSVYGTVQESKTVIVHAGNECYYFTQLTLSITKIYYNTEEPDTVSVVYVHKYRKYGPHSYKSQTQYEPVAGYTSNMNMGYCATKNREGLLVFEPSAGHSVTINETSYDLSLYADYYMVAFLLYDPREPWNCYYVNDIGGFYKDCFENNCENRPHYDEYER